MRLFIDMDGTLAKWNNVEFEQLFEKGYYRELEPNKDVLEDVRQLVKAGYDVYILSCVLPESKYALEEKKEWLKEHLSELPEEKYIFVPYGQNKADYLRENYSPITESDYLIDDYTQNLLEWREFGGTGVKYLNGINHTRGTWDGDMIYQNRIGIVDRIQTLITYAMEHDVTNRAGVPAPIINEKYEKEESRAKARDDITFKGEEVFWTVAPNNYIHTGKGFIGSYDECVEFATKMGYTNSNCQIDLMLTIDGIPPYGPGYICDSVNDWNKAELEKQYPTREDVEQYISNHMEELEEFYCPGGININPLADQLCSATQENPEPFQYACKENLSFKELAYWLNLNYAVGFHLEYAEEKYVKNFLDEKGVTPIGLIPISGKETNVYIFGGYKDEKLLADALAYEGEPEAQEIASKIEKVIIRDFRRSLYEEACIKYRYEYEKDHSNNETYLFDINEYDDPDYYEIQEQAKQEQIEEKASEDITYKGKEIFWSVESEANSYCDDEYNGSYNECVEYAAKTGYTNNDCQISRVLAIDGVVDYCYDTVNDWNEAEDVEDQSVSNEPEAGEKYITKKQKGRK